MTTGPAEPATAKELKKQLRRLKHVGNGSSSEAAALEERLTGERNLGEGSGTGQGLDHGEVEALAECRCVKGDR